MNFDQSIRRYSVGHRFALRIGVLALTALALAGCGGGGGGENSDGTRFPLANATWTQTDSSGIVVRLDKRTDKTRLLAGAEGGNDYENFIGVGTLSISL